MSNFRYLSASTGFLVPFILSALETYAEPMKSAYTSTEPENCTSVGTENGAPVLRCPGPEGHVFLMNIAEHKVFLSCGPEPMREKVWTETMPGTHRIGDVMEWVLTGTTPVATIVRYFIDRSAADLPEEQVLVVTRLGQANSCHVAYIDARRNDNANEIARDAVSTYAMAWDCREVTARSIGIMGIPELAE